MVSIESKQTIDLYSFEIITNLLIISIKLIKEKIIIRLSPTTKITKLTKYYNYI